MEKKIIIIGAGIAGLSAGCYARMNGYDAEIYESHSLPGGLCTSWKKGEYTIDGCLHWLTGSAPSDSFYHIWKELGAVQGRRIYDHQEFYRYTGSDGRTFILYNNADRLEKHMKELSPGDTESIELLCRLIRKFTKFKSPLNKAFELFNFLDIIRMIFTMRPFMKDLNLCNSLTMGEFAGRFKDPLLQEVFPLILGDKDMSLFAFVITMALLHNRAGGFPEGGSLEFARAIEKRLLNLGGKIFYGKKVEKILVKDGDAYGIQLAKGVEILGDYVISCADMQATVYKMLDGCYIEPQHEELFSNEKIFNSSVQVSFGVNMDFSNDSDCVAQVYKLSAPLLIGNMKTDWIMIRNYSFDPTLAPKGKTVVESTFMVDDFDYWERLYADKAAYKSEKERIATIVSEELEKKYPGFISHIEVTDVLTPMTYVRYTGNYRGSYMTWIMTPGLMKRHRMIKKTLPGLKNFWLSGMWVQPPGGVPTGAKTSRDILQIICRIDKKKFIAIEA
ncbi:MAG: NAD(P)/FAD-dependent oxidoreductase [Bacteroidales bacterium]|jgi:phytoene dehydrogenase-like protein